MALLACALLAAYFALAYRYQFRLPPEAVGDQFHPARGWLFTVFCGHLLLPFRLCAVEWTEMRAAGLAVTVIALALLAFVDRGLAAHFSTCPRWLCERGPFRFVRHPRYAALLLLHIGFALAFLSAQSLALAVFVAVFVGVRVFHEERYLRDRFGVYWLKYAARRKRFIPGVF
jgi:protein-S-isoprenylcysteine O-methyltransferase Ste14